MGYSLRPAITTEAKPLIGLYSESGNGKTKSSLLIAKGFTGDMGKVAMIETEAGRGEVYADDPMVGGYLVRPIRNNFAPIEYGKALAELEKADIQVAIIDSASHEWEGANGVLGWAARNQEEGKKGVLVWQQPKMSHIRDFVLRLLQTPIPLVIICMRAKYPMKEIMKDGKKDWVRSEYLEPKQADDFLFEMMVHGWIDAKHNFHGTKYTTDEFRKILVDKEPITVETGKRLAEWAAGGIKKPGLQKMDIILPTKNQRDKIAELMHTTGLETADEKLAFWKYLTVTGETAELADRIIANFGEYHQAYSRMLDAETEDVHY